MGQEIVYCVKCLTRLTGADLDRGKGRRFGHRVACQDCLPEVLASLPPEERELEPIATPKPRELPRRPGSSSAHPAVPGSTPRAFRAPAAASNSWPWVGGGGALLLVAVVVALASRAPDPGPAPPPPKEAVAAKPPPPPPKDPRLEEARALYARARTLELSKPRELDGIVAAYEEALRKADGTALFTEVVRAFDAAVARRKEARFKTDLDADRAVRDALAREDFAAARELAAKLPGGDGSARVRQHAETLLAEARRLAAEASRRNDERQLLQLRERVLRWGYVDLVAAFDAADGWRPLFDGRTTGFLLGITVGNWKVEGGVLVPAGERVAPLKTKEEFGDVDLRLRLEFAEASNLCFWGRQTGDGMMGLEWGRPALDALRGAPHTYILSLRGDKVTLSIDGVAHPAEVRGRVPQGHCQVSGVGKGWRLLGLDVRPAPAEPVASAWKTISDGRSLDWMNATSRRHWALEGGGIVPLVVQGTRDTIQSRERFGEGEYRLVFEITGPLEVLTLGVRQGANGRVAVTLAGGRLKSLRAGRNTLLLVSRGTSSTATVNGEAQDAYAAGTPDDAGHIQISCQGEGVRLCTLEWRELPR